MELTIQYEKDFNSWLMINASLLREKKFMEIDAENIATELESMGKRDKRELISRFSILITHLLKWKYQSVKRTRGWTNTISAQRIDINDLFEDSPSLHHNIHEKINKAYKKARLMAEDETCGETDIDKEQFPTDCPFTFTEMLNEEFFPEAS